MSQQQQQQQQQGNLTEDDAVNSILMSVSYFEHEECGKQIKDFQQKEMIKNTQNESLQCLLKLKMFM